MAFRARPPEYRGARPTPRILSLISTRTQYKVLFLQRQRWPYTAGHALATRVTRDRFSGMKREHEIQIRVRYQETDAQGRVHHANYFTYFEMGRVEQLRAAGIQYGDLEREGTLLVIHQIQCRYIQPASYDDLLVLRTIVERVTPARIEHRYEILRDGMKIASGHSVLACVDRHGKVRRIPDWMTIEDTDHNTPGQA